MNIDGLKVLWQEAFGDPVSFIDGFFQTGFHPDRCCTLEQGGKITAALYWFDCFWGQNKYAYLYAVAVAKSHRGQQLSLQLLEKAHSILARNGYTGALLHPASAGLFDLYRKAGYETQCHINTFTCSAGSPISLEELTPAQYAQARQTFLPEKGLTQEGDTLTYLNTWCKFYRGEDVLLCAFEDQGILLVRELLGNRDKAPGIVSALGATRGEFYTPGDQVPFAMYRPITHGPVPGYLGLALD